MTKAKIAILEDDSAIANMYRIKFETEGLTVETAENGKTGLELIKKMNPDLILLDLMMPEMNGDQVLRELRSSSWGKELKVIILTNMGKQEAPQDIDSLGIEDFIVKAEMTPKQVSEIVKQTI